MSLENFLSALDKLPEEQKDLKGELKTLYQKVNKEKGEALTDLTTIKEKNNELKSKTDRLEKSATDFETLTAALKKLNIDMSNADKLAEQLQIEKTDQDKIKQLEAIAKEAQDKLKDAETKLRNIDVEKKLQPKLEEAIKNFKDKDGNAYKLSNHFIDKQELLESNLDLDSEVLVNDAITKALNKGYEKQVNFQKETGFVLDEKQIHDVNTGDTRHFQTKGEEPITTESFKEARERGGDLASVAAVLDKLKPPPPLN